MHHAIAVRGRRLKSRDMNVKRRSQDRGSWLTGFSREDIIWMLGKRPVQVPDVAEERDHATELDDMDAIETDGIVDWDAEPDMYPARKIEVNGRYVCTWTTTTDLGFIEPDEWR